MSRREPRTRNLGVVVPIHDEEELLGGALNALGAALGDIRGAQIPAHVALVFDSCRDASVPIAHKWIESHSRRAPFTVSIVTSAARNVGVARRLGCAAVLDHWKEQSPEYVWIATTDADSRVPRAWLREQVRCHERGCDVWAGRVAVKGDSDAVRRWQSEYDREAHPVHGASLGFNAANYLGAGGFPSLETGEDRALVSALAQSGAAVCFDSSHRVLTSARPGGRAPHGFAEALRRFDTIYGASAD